MNTKVFSRGNNLIYELDMLTRQLRLVKDNIFTMEGKVKKKVRLYFDHDLDQTRMILEETKKKFAEYKVNLNSTLKCEVKENINEMDQIIKKRVERYRIESSGDTDLLLDGAGQKKEETLSDKYSHLLKKTRGGQE